MSVQIGYPAGLLEEQLLILLPESDHRKQRAVHIPEPDHASEPALSAARQEPVQQYPSMSGMALDEVVQQLEAGLHRQ